MKKELLSLLAQVAAFLLAVTLLFAMCAYQWAREEQLEAENREIVRAAAPVMVLEAKPVPMLTPAPTPEPTPEPKEIPAPAEPETVEISTQYNVPLDIELQQFVIDVCTDKQIDPAVVFAMMDVESDFRADVMGDGGNSYGLMQIQRRYHIERMEKLSVTDLLDPKSNVAVGVDYLAELRDKYESLDMALVAYNAGELGAYNGWFSVGRTNSDYSRAVFAIAETLAEGVITSVLQ